MKLYYSKGACSLVSRIIIHELGLKSEFESVDLKTKITESGANFLEINSKGAVPTLVTDDKMILTENAVILQYLADHSKNTSLLPSINDINRYRVLEWLNFISTELHKSFGPLFNPKTPEEFKTTVAFPLLTARFKFIDQNLDKKSYLMGDTFTLPDAYLFVMLTWAKHFKIDLSEFKNIQRFSVELSKRPSVAQSLNEEFGARS